MSGRISYAMTRALATWKNLKRTPIYGHAEFYGLNPSSLYKALKRTGKLRKKNGA